MMRQHVSAVWLAHVPGAVYANRALERSGKFWQKESFDHYVRDKKEFWRILNYILNNPVKAGLVEKWEDYPFTYLKMDKAPDALPCSSASSAWAFAICT